MSREEIAAHQRSRLYGAMVESVARRGYAATTVADLVGHAGVSHRALYEHFRDKHECFCATHDSLVAHARNGAVRAWRTHQGWDNQLHAACRDVFERAAAYPDAARLVLVDSPLVAPGGAERAQLSSLAFERLLHATARAGMLAGEPPALSARAIVGGIRSVLQARVVGGRPQELDTLADEIVDWTDAYRPPRGSRPLPKRLVLASAARNRPPERPLVPERVDERVLSALAELVTEVGYDGVTDSQLARRARVPTQALHKHFSDKKECARVLLDAFDGQAFDAVSQAMDEVEEWPARAFVGVSAYLAWLAAHPTAARLLFLGVFEVGPVSSESLDGHVDRLVARLADGAPEALRAGRVVAEATSGAIRATILNQVAAGKVRQLPAFAGQLGFVLVAPFVGARVAREQLASTFTEEQPA